jgi:hypothetical protein
VSGMPTIRPSDEKRPWDMPMSQSNSVLKTWTHADFTVPILQTA